ncbi:MAG: NAD(P)/FAD-dependent oxidoreductase [Capsulimonas sp.]|uniref:NAD(P)/FAD-dependent oxidoreductase n=1 Tax=Capsulimonas sp. TaxID=2494211 RepID=UPI0032671B28
MQQNVIASDTDYEAIVVGGSFAGLSAAMQLARARRRILVVDAGKPRNRFSAASHGFFGQDGRSPREIMETARAQVMAYPTVDFYSGEAVTAAQEAGVLAVTFGDGDIARAKRLVLATGVVDHLPDVPGMQGLWGGGVIHCPYCHGYEVAERKIAVFGEDEVSVHKSILVSDWSADVTLLTNGGNWLTQEHRDRLALRNIRVEETPVARLVPRGRELDAVEFQDGRRVPYGAMFVGTRVSLASPLAEQLGCEIEEGMQGPMIKTNDFKETTVAGVYAAGDAARMMHNATLASADGVLAGVISHQSMLPK